MALPASATCQLNIPLLGQEKATFRQVAFALLLLQQQFIEDADTLGILRHASVGRALACDRDHGKWMKG